jgi:hypothetical protein
MTAPDTPDTIHEPRLWRDDGWTARVIKNDDDEGWAVEMIKDSEAEPALVGPWTMGRDKKNPKPLDSAAFITLVKTAREVLRRHEQQTAAALHKSVTVDGRSDGRVDAEIDGAAGRITVKLDIVADEDDPFATLSAFDAMGDQLASVKVGAGYRLDARSASAWIDGGFARPD